MSLQGVEVTEQGDHDLAGAVFGVCASPVEDLVEAFAGGTARQLA
jgi:hypothetical protein